MSRKSIVKNIMVVVACSLILYFGLFPPTKVKEFFEEPIAVAASTKDPSLVLMAKDSPDMNCTVYVYRYYTSTGYCDFVVVSRNFKDGAAVTQLK